MSWILKPCGSPCISPTDLCAAAAGRRTLKMKMPRPHAADMIIKIKPRSVREKKAWQAKFQPHLHPGLWWITVKKQHSLVWRWVCLQVFFSLQTADSSQNLQKLPFPRLSLSSCSSPCTLRELNTKSDSPPMFPQTHQGHAPLIKLFLSLWTCRRTRQEHCSGTVCVWSLQNCTSDFQLASCYCLAAWHLHCPLFFQKPHPSGSQAG